MAEETPKLPAGLSVGLPSRIKKKAKAKKPVARPVGRPAPLVALHERYGLVYEPGQEADPLVKDELDALNELYRQRAGRDITDEPDVRVALERAGFLKPTVSQKRAAGLRRGAESVFASALDALDYEKRQLSKPFYEAEAFQKPISYAAEAIGGEGASRAVESAVEAVDKALGKAIGPAIAAQAGMLQPFTLFAATPAGREVAAPIVETGLRGLQRIAAAGGPTQTRFSRVQGPTAPPPAPIARNRPIQDVLFERLGEMPLPIPTAQSFAQLGGVGVREGILVYEQPTLGDVQEASKIIATKPNKYIDASAQDKTAILGASSPVLAGIGLAIDGLTGPEIQTAMEQAGFDGLSPNEDRRLRERARKAGHDVTNWERLFPGEKVAMAYTTGNDAIVTLRNAGRAIGAMGATPAGIKAIGDAAFAALRGDTAEGEGVIRTLIEPYAYAKDVAARDGLAAGLGVAFRDNPVDFAFAVNTAIRAGGRIGGAIARTGRLGKGAAEFAEPGRAVTITPRYRGEGEGGVRQVQEIPLTPGPFKYRPGSGTIIEQYIAWQKRTRELEIENAAKIEEARAAGRVDEQGTPYEIQRAQVAPEVLIGYTTRNLTSGVSLAVKAGLARRFPSYASWLQNRRGRLFTRTQANIADGIAVEIERILTESLGTRATDDQKLRAAWLLSRPTVLFGDEPYTPRVEADFYRSEIDRVRNSAEFRRDPENPDLTGQIKRWEDAITELDRIDAVELDAETVARIRERAREIGEDNTKIIAAAMGEAADVAKRRDYIRLLVVDPRFEEAARTLRSTANEAIRRDTVALIMSQRRIRRISNLIQEKVSEAGYGKKGKRKSQQRFNQLRNDLVNALRRAEKAALALGDDALARQYREARSQLTLARASAPQRTAELAARMAAIQRLEADGVELPPAAIGPYRRAQAAAEELAAAERAAEEALGAVRSTRGAPLRRTPTERDLGAAEESLASARERLAALESFPTPDEAAVASARSAVSAAEERLAALSGAREAGLLVTEARKTATMTAREVKRIADRGRPVLDTGQVRAALDVSGDVAGVRIRRAREYGYYTLERARGEVLDDFIARVEANDQAALLHLVQKGSFKSVGEAPEVRTTQLIETGPKGRIRKTRLKPSRGSLFAMGGEDLASMWRNLMFDTSELQSAVGWRTKMQQLIEATSLKVSVSEQILRAAERDARRIVDEDPSLVYDDVLREQVLAGLRRDSFEFNLVDFELLNPVEPKAKVPTKRTPIGMTTDPESIAALMMREITDRTIDPNAPGDYYLMPRAIYDGIQTSLKDEAFRFRPTGNLKISSYNLDRLVRAWRSLTLNLLPKTAFANIAGSSILALQGGAGPRSWYMAWRALTGRVDPKTGRKYPVPKELLQRYYDQFTPQVGTRGRLSGKPEIVQVGAAWVAWWMNSMRRLNGMSEDFGRLAVWYSKAAPEAVRRGNDGGNFIMNRAKSLNDAAMDALESMARNDPEWVAKNDEWLRQSYDFLGYLHRGGRGASYVRIAIPFWQWYVHMLKLTFVTMPLKYPGRALFLQQLGEIGDEYQRTHGVLFPWAADLIPLWSYETEVENRPQFVTAAIGASLWYPQGTPAEIADKDGKLNVLGYVRGSVNPIFSNSLLLGLTLASVVNDPQAFEYSDYDGVKAAKNEYGNEVTGFGDFANYIANRLGQMVPLAPTIMSMAGRPTTSTLWNLQEKPQKGAAIPTRRTDAVTMFQDPWGPQPLAFLLKALTGIQVMETPGLGPVYKERMRRMYEYEENKIKEEERNMAEKIAQILSSGGDVEAQTPARPGGTEQ